MLLHLVVMGVAGSGKSTVAEGLRDALGWPLAEGDDLHPEANVAKMSAGVPLTDEDRWPWLERIVDWTSAQHAKGRSTVVTCSALRRVYRDRLRRAPGRTVFAHLAGSPDLLGERMSARGGHFMPTSLLPSQFATLEPLEADEDGFTLDVSADVDTLVAEVLARLVPGAAPQASRPGLRAPDASDR